MGDGRYNSIIVLALVFLVGLLIGWFALGWGLFPVSYSDAYLRDLNPEDTKTVITTTAEAFELTGDQAVAVERLQALGTQEEVAQLAAEVVQEATEAGDPVTASRVSTMASAVGLQLPVPEQPTAEAEATLTPESEEEPGGLGQALLTICRAGLGILVVLAGIGLALWLLSKRRGSEDEGAEEAAQEPGPTPAGRHAPPPATATDWEQVNQVYAPPADRAGGTAVAREFVATFEPGDPTFDESFDIEAPDGNGYLGECGMTLSEMIGGDPSKVTALEVWLFDKSDIRTVTTVLMSDYAYGNQSMRDKLQSRGNAVLARQGEAFVLDAQTLRLEGRITELQYNDGESTPRSTFRRLTVNLRVVAHQSGQA